MANEEFDATFRIEGYERGRSALNAFIRNVQTGERHKMTLDNIWKFVRGTEFSGRFFEQKRGPSLLVEEARRV